MPDGNIDTNPEATVQATRVARPARRSTLDRPPEDIAPDFSVEATVAGGVATERAAPSPLPEVMAEPDAPVSTPALPPLPALDAEDSAPAAPAPAAAPSPVAAGRRRSSLGAPSEPMAPVASDEALGTGEKTEADAEVAPPSITPSGPAPAAAAPVASSVAAAVNAPPAPQAPDGSSIVTDAMRARAEGFIPTPGSISNGDVGGEEAVPVDGISADPTAPGISAVDAAVGGDAPAGAAAAPAVPPPEDEEDPLPPFEPTQDAVYNAVMALLYDARGDARRASLDKDAMIRARMAQLTDQAAREDARKDLEARAQAAAMAQGGGRGSLLGALLDGVGGGIGAVGRGIGRAVGGDGAGQPRAEFNRLAEQLSAQRAFRRIAMDRQFPRTIEAAHNMYRAHEALNTGIGKLNGDLAAHAEGSSFMTDLNALAERRGVEPSSIWEAIHDRKQADPETSDLRSRADALVRDPVLGPQINQLEAASRGFGANADRLMSGLKTAKASGMKMDGLGERFGEALGGMQSPDAGLARPGGERLDAMQKRMREMAEKIAEMTRKLVDNIKAMFGLGRSA